MTKRICSLLLCLCMVWSMVSGTVTPAQATEPETASESQNKVYFGNLCIEGGVQGVDYAVYDSGNDRRIDIFSSTPITISTVDQTQVYIQEGVRINITQPSDEFQPANPVSLDNPANLTLCSVRLKPVIERSSDFDRTKTPLRLDEDLALNLTLEGENFLNGVGNGAGLQIGANSVLTIDGTGILTAEGCGSGSNTYGGAGIGNSSLTGGSSHIIIKSGTIYAYGTDFSPGICVNSPGSFTMEGGTVYATSTKGAGIGTMPSSKLGTIRILGGHVTAIGDGDDLHAAPGIGSTDSPSSGSIEILGGNVIAKGNYRGAGLNALVTISGGMVYAQGDEGYNKELGGIQYKPNITGGLVINGDTGMLYTDQTLVDDLIIKKGMTLTIPAGRTLTIPENVHILNMGTITGEGRIVLDGGEVFSEAEIILGGQKLEGVQPSGMDSDYSEFYCLPEVSWQILLNGVAQNPAGSPAASMTVQEGDRVEISVTASNVFQPTYQWYRGTVWNDGQGLREYEIVGANSPTLVLENVTEGDTVESVGSTLFYPYRYFCRVTSNIDVTGDIPLGFNFCNSKQLILNIDYSHKNHCACNGEAPQGHTCNEVEWTAWEDQTSLPTEPGSYHLTGDVTLSEKWNVPLDGVDLCLNGHSVALAEGVTDEQVICVGRNLDLEQSASLVLTDCRGSGEIRGASGKLSGGGISVGDQAELTMYAGKITGNTADSGGGILIGGGSIVNLYGGEISGNHANLQGGGIYLQDRVSELNIAGDVRIHGNTCGEDKHTENIFLDDKNYPNDDLSVQSWMNVGTLTENANIGVSPKLLDEAFTRGGANQAECFFSDNPNYAVVAEGENLKLTDQGYTLTVRSETTNSVYTEGSARIHGAGFTQAKFAPGSIVTIETVRDTSDGRRIGITCMTDPENLVHAIDDKDGTITLAMPEHDVTATVQFAIEPYYITYDTQGGTNHPDNPSEYMSNSGETIILQPATRPGYDFLGWFTPDGKQMIKMEIWYAPYQFTKMDYHLTARWRLTSYTIEYDLNGGSSNSPDNRRSYTILDDTIPLCPAAWEGYRFLGWTDENGDAVTEISTDSLRHIKLTAQWEAHVHDYQWTYEGLYHWQECVSCHDVINREMHHDTATPIPDTITHLRECPICGDSGIEACHGTDDGNCQTSLICQTCQGEIRSAGVHIYTNDCDNACDNCGEARAVSHNYQTRHDEANHWKECSACQDKQDVAAHSFGSWTHVDGTNTHSRSCACGYAETDTCAGTDDNDCETPLLCDVCANVLVDSASHTYDDACDADCNVCGAIREAPHDYQSKHDDNDHWLECSRCQTKKDVQSHTFGSCTHVYSTKTHSKRCACGYTVTEYCYGVDDVNCETALICDGCGNAILPASPHNYTDVCDADCNVCGTIREVTHSYAQKYGETTHWMECVVCQVKKDEAAHSGGTASCVEQAVCATCAQPYGSVAPGNHTSNEVTYTDNADGATHTATQVCCNTIADAAQAHELEADVCVKCGYHAVDYIEIELEVGDTATASQDGLEQAMSEADITISDESVVSVSMKVRKKGSWWQWGGSGSGTTTTYNHTITFEGLKPGTTVVKVGNVYYKVTVTGDCSHQWAEEVIAPTCDTKGYTIFTCTLCGECYKDNYVKALSHSYADGICEHCGKKKPSAGGWWNWWDSWKP